MQKKLDKEIIQGTFFKINKKISKRITAKYHRIKDFKMDPRGYFLIDLDRKNNLLRVGYCTITKQKNKLINDMVAEITGTTALEILNTLIREKFISTLQHAGDMGIELHKAELALKYNLEYIQDKNLKLTTKTKN